MSSLIQRTAPRMQITSRYAVRFAERRDDAAIRRLLRNREMQGSIRLSFEREPSYFAGLDRECVRHDTVVIEDRRVGDIIAMGARQVYPAFLNGEPTQIGYLSQLRFAAGRRLLPKAAEEAWGLLGSTRRGDELPFDITSIAADNLPARRLLERGLRSHPRYCPLGQYTVHAIPTTIRARAPRDVEIREADDAAWQEELSIHLTQLGGKALVMRGPHDDDQIIRLVASHQGHIIAGLAIDDASTRRQFVVRGYEGGLRWTRPLINLGMRFRGAPSLPQVGTTLRVGSITVLTCREGSEAAIVPLVRCAAAYARSRDMALLLVGFVAGDPLGTSIERAYRSRTYGTNLYTVVWDASPDTIPRLRPEDVIVELQTL